MTLRASSMLGATARKVSSEVFLLGRLPDAGNRPRTHWPAPADAQARASPSARSTRAPAARPEPRFARFYGIGTRRPSPFRPAGVLRWRDCPEAIRNPQQA